MTDTALALRKSFDQGKNLSDIEITTLLEQSETMAKLTQAFTAEPFFAIFRIICLAEIPYSERLPYTQHLLNYLQNQVVTSAGFSYTGKSAGIVPCYNALLLEAFTRLQLADSAAVQQALSWIKKYQLFARNEQSAWSGAGICKHGGCLKAVPCYIGIGKTVRALITYANYTQHSDPEVTELITQGVEYMLQHQLFQRLSNHEPISRHITDIMFPQAYMLSLTDLVYISQQLDLWSDKRTLPLQSLVRAKAKKWCALEN